MQAFELEFKILTICGIWLPLSWRESRRLQLFYKVYSFFVAGSIRMLFALQVLLIFTREINLDFITQLLFTLVTGLSANVKVTTILSRRNEVIQLVNLLTTNQCIPQDLEEIRIKKETDAFIRKLSIAFNMMAQATLVGFFIAPFAKEEEYRKLPFEIWLPCDVHRGSNYLITYFIEIPIVILAILAYITVSNIIYGLELQACAQFECIRHRIYKLCDSVEDNIISKEVGRKDLDLHEQKILAQCVDHHNYILKFSRTLCKTFDAVFVQVYLCSVLLISVLVYHISTTNSSVIDGIQSLAYLSVIIAEVFVYCWFGNELTIKSSSFGIDIYNTANWMLLNKKSKRTLRFIMLRATHPVRINFGSIVNYNLDSFKSILKVTYSTFNILKKRN